MKSNKLTLNKNKSNLILFSSIKDPAHFKLKENTESQRAAKHLGIIIDDKLFFHNHVQFIK